MNDCIRWTGNVGNRGYGRVGSGAQGVWLLAHRVAYEEANGPIPGGMHVHHRCENRLCVNPEHMELVTPSNHSKIHNPRPTVCKHVHELTPENTWTSKKGHRYCKACRAARMRQYTAERRYSYRLRSVAAPGDEPGCEHGSRSARSAGSEAAGSPLGLIA